MQSPGFFWPLSLGGPWILVLVWLGEWNPVFHEYCQESVHVGTRWSFWGCVVADHFRDSCKANHLSLVNLDLHLPVIKYATHSNWRVGSFNEPVTLTNRYMLKKRISRSSSWNLPIYHGISYVTWLQASQSQNARQIYVSASIDGAKQMLLDGPLFRWSCQRDVTCVMLDVSRYVSACNRRAFSS